MCKKKKYGTRDDALANMLRMCTQTGTSKWRVEPYRCVVCIFDGGKRAWHFGHVRRVPGKRNSRAGKRKTYH